jgi:hypothetical protein
MFETVHRNLKETGTFMLHSLLGHERSNAWDEEEVLDIVHDNPPTSTRHVSYATRLSQTAGWRALLENQSYPFHVLVQLVAARGRTALCPVLAGTNISVSTSPDGRYMQLKVIK